MSYWQLLQIYSWDQDVDKAVTIANAALAEVTEGLDPLEVIEKGYLKGFLRNIQIRIVWLF